MDREGGEMHGLECCVLSVIGFPQGPEGVAIDEPRKVAFVTNYACNSVTSIAIDPAGYKKTDGSIAPYGSILNTVTVGPNPIGIATISPLGFTVVANSSDTPTS